MVLRYLWPAIVWSIIVLVLTLLPGEEFPTVPVFGIDKVVHFFIFGLLTTLTAYGLYQLSKRSHSIQRPDLFSLLYCTMFSIIIELLQRYVPGRNFSILDIIANIIGVALGYLAFNFWRKREESKT